MTYVDMVFPSFLFILGMVSLSRFKNGDHIPAILGHIALRSAARHQREQGYGHTYAAEGEHAWVSCDLF